MWMIKKKFIFLSVTLKLCYIHRISLKCDPNLKSKTSLVKKYICTFMLIENNTVNSRDHQFEFYNFNNIILIIKKNQNNIILIRMNDTNT
jgi:hypothetical protein